MSVFMMRSIVRLVGLSFLLFSAISFSQEPELLVPDLQVDATEIDSGRYQLSWTYDEAVEHPLFFTRIEETVNGELGVGYTEEMSQYYWSDVAGDYSYRAQACYLDEEREPACGPLSAAVTVTVPEGLSVTAPIPEPGEGGGIEPESGPGSVVPGTYQSSITKWNAWQLNWVSDLRYPADNGQQNTYELLIWWSTYEYSAAHGRYIPIWLWAQVSNLSPGAGFYEGDLHYNVRDHATGQVTPHVVGKVRITRDSLNPEQATVSWRTTRSGMYATQAQNSWVEDTLVYSDHLPPGNDPAPHDHMQGDWVHLQTDGTTDNRFILNAWIDKNLESLNFMFYDGQGQPIWARGDWWKSQDFPPSTSMERFCTYTVFDAIAPDTMPDFPRPPAVWLGCEDDDWSTFNVGRTYDPVAPGHRRYGELWTNIQLPSFRPGALTLGNSGSPIDIHKWTNFHDIRTIIGGSEEETVCNRPQGQPCQLELMWFRDGNYPQASVFRLNTATGERITVQVNTPDVSEGLGHDIAEDGTYQFEIRRDNMSTSDLLAISSEIEVTTTAAPQLLIEPGEYDFGDTLLGPQEVSGYRFTVINDGADSVEITGLQSTSPFTIMSQSGTTCEESTELAPGAECVVVVGFWPYAEGSLGPYQGTLTIESTGGNTSVPLSGSAVASCGPEPEPSGADLLLSMGLEDVTLARMIPQNTPASDSPGPFTLTWESDTREATHEADLYALVLTRYEQDTPVRSRVHYLEEPEVRLGLYEPGAWEYRLQACIFEKEELHCGEPSAPEKLTVTDGPVRGRLEVPRSALPEIQGTPASPAAVPVGSYQSGITRYNGWHFSWINDLRFAGPGGYPRDIFELFGIWATYRDFAGPEPAPDDENLQPVWLSMHARPNPDSPGVYDGSLHYWEIIGGEQQETLVGDIRLCLDGPDDKPRVEWHLDDGSFYQHGARTVIDDLTSTIDAFGVSNHPNEIDHYQGAWHRPSPPTEEDRVSLFFSMAGDLEMNLLAFYDHEGKPIWGNAIWEGYSDGIPATQDEENFCFYGMQNTWYPDIPFPDQEAQLVEYGDCDSGGGDNKWNMQRAFDDLEPGLSQSGKLNLDISVPPSFRGQPRDLAVTDAVIEKTAGYHEIRYFAGDVIFEDDFEELEPNPPVCVIDGEYGCILTMYWYTGGDYPDAKVYLRKQNPTGPTEYVAAWTDPDKRSRSGYLYYNELYEPGTYRFELWRVQADQDQLLTHTDWFDVEIEDAPGVPETPPAPVEDPLYSPDDDSSRVGATTGEFRVDESGAANYGIPIMTVPGSGGVAPEVAVSYNSHAGSGPLGLGWSLSGFSTITRCGQTLEQDGQATGVTLTASDRFCLDGQKLMLIAGTYGANGSEYRLEIDDFTRITAYHEPSIDGPAYFIVERKDGSASVYGSSDAGNSARVDAPDAGVVFAWPVSRFEDSAGNFIDYQYLHPSPNWIEWLPEAVHYTGNANVGFAPYANIQFVYDTLNENARASGYVAGQRVRTTRRLEEINSYGESDQLIRQYHLGYRQNNPGSTDHELLDEIQECWGTGSDECLNPTRFGWRSGRVELPASVRQTNILTFDGFQTALSGDLTGNGRQEVVYLSQRNGESYFSTLVNLNTENIQLSSVKEAQAGCSIKAENIDAITITDLNGDGYQELVYAATDCRNSADNDIYYHEWIHGSGTLGPAVPLDVNFFDTPFDWVADRLTAVDWDGDGLADLVLSRSYCGLDAGCPSSEHLSHNDTFIHNTSSGGDTTLSTRNWPNSARDALSFPDEYKGCEVRGIRAERGLFAPAVDIDGSGTAGLTMRAKARLRNCPPETLQEFSEPRWFWDEGEDDEPWELGEGEIIQAVDAIFQIGLTEVDGEPRLRAIHAVPFEHGIGRYRDLLIPVDLNMDGLADFVVVDADPDRSGNQRNVHLHINNGKSFEYVGVPFTLHKDIAGLVRILDYTSNGRPDFLIPSHHDHGDAVWLVSLWEPGDIGDGGFSSDCADGLNGNGNYGPGCIVGPRAGRIGSGSDSVFADLLGNGTNGLLSFYKKGGWNDCSLGGSRDYCVYASVYRGAHHTSHGYLGLNLHRIFRVSDGLGAHTFIAHKSLAQRSVYTRDNNGPYSDYGNGAVVYDTVIPAFVVWAAESSAPQAINGNFVPGVRNRVEYYYTGAKLQAGGRGMLGFREVASYNHRSGMVTRTRYRQNFPYIGLPEETESWYQTGGKPWPVSDSQADIAPCSDTQGCENGAIVPGIRLGRTQNNWGVIPVGDGAYHPYLARSIEETHVPEYSSGQMKSSRFSHRVMTNVANLDAYGNPQLLDVATFTSESDFSELVARQRTVNGYSNDPNAWRLGRLTCATVTSIQPGQVNQVRRSTFDYHPDTGILTRETIGAHSCTDTAGRLTTTYMLDDFGNREQTTVSGQGIDSDRHSRDLYDSLGRFINTRQVRIGSGEQTTETVLARDRHGNPTRVRNGQGVTMYHYYDRMGRLHYTYTPDGAWSRTLYSTDTAGCPAGTAFVELGDSSDGARSEVCRDVLGRESRVRSLSFDGSRWHQTDTWYDHASRPVAVSEPYFGSPQYWTNTDYDELGRVLQVTHPDDSREQWTYEGLTTTHINALDQVHVVTANPLGEKIAEEAADGGTTNYEYDALGQLIWVDGPLNGTDDRVTIEYDELGHKTRMIDPDKGEWHFRHNALGELVCQSDEKDQGTYFKYDALGRPERREDRSGVTDVEACSGTHVGTTTWNYGNISGQEEFGEVTFEQSGYAGDQSSRAYEHDELGRIRKVTTTIIGADDFARTYIERTTYDEFGRVFQRFDASNGTDSDGGRGIRYVYNDQGHLEALREANEGTLGRVYWEVQQQDARGNVTEALLGNGVIANAGYDAATGRLLNLQAVNNPGAIAAQDLELWWDALGNLACRRDHSDQAAILSEKFGYDARNRLEWSAYLPCESEDPAPQDQDMSMGYDLAGNVTAKSGVGSYTYNPVNRPHAVTSAGGRTFEYDGNGNVTGDGARSFDYTTFDKLRRISTGSKHTDFGYGPSREKVLQREVQGTTVQSRTHYVGNVEIVWNGASPGQNTGEYRRYIGGVALVTFDEQDGTTQARYLHKDHLGSVTAITDQNGDIEARMAYDPWGQRRHPGDLNQPWDQWTQPAPPNWGPLADTMLDLTLRGYTDHEQVDDHGIVHMRGRIYDPHLGRFLQADPFVEDSTTLNRYTYVHNNPLAYTDPSGYFSWKKTFKQAAGLAVIIASGGYGASIGGWAGFWVTTTGSFVGGYLATGTVQGAFTSAAFVSGTAGAIQLQRQQSLSTPTNGERSTGADPSTAAIASASERTMQQPLGERAISTIGRPDVGEPRDLHMPSEWRFDYTGFVINEIRLDQLEAIHRQELIEEELWVRTQQSGAITPFVIEDIFVPVFRIRRAERVVTKVLDFGKGSRKLDFLFNRNINPANLNNVRRARGNADRIGIADTPANRAEVTRRFNNAFNDPSSIVPGGTNIPGRNLREFFLPGVTGTGSKIQYVEEGGRVITIIAK